MVKKNALTPVLAGILSVSVVGSGVGYYVMSKDADEGGKNKTGVSDTAKTSPRLSAVAQNIENTMDTVEKAVNGELDYSNTTTMTLSFGEGFSELTDGQSFKDMKLVTSAKQKGGNNQLDASFYYGDGKLGTITEITDRENGTAYFKVPELSDAYITANKDDVEQMMKDRMGYDPSAMLSSVENVDYDYDALNADLEEYEKLVKENFPEVISTDNINGDISGVSYEYICKSYEVTSTDAMNVAKAVLEHLKTDETFKEIYNSTMDAQKDRMREMYRNYGMEESEIEQYISQMPTYDSQIDEALTSINNDLQEEISNESVKLDLYEDTDGSFVGFKFVPTEGEGEMKLILVSNDEASAIDYEFYDGSDGSSNVSIIGAIKLENEALNGGYTISFGEEGKVEFTVTNLKASENMFTGTMRFDAKIDDGGDAASGWLEISSASDNDNVDVKFDIGYNGKNLITLKVESVKTEASDVEMPASDAVTYNGTDEEALNKYLEGCDVEGFKANAKSVLGDELYNEMFESSSSASQNYELDDYYDEFDFAELE